MERRGIIMTKVLLGIALCAAAPFVQAGEAATQQVARAGTQASVFGLPEYFTGRVRVDPLFPATDEIPAAAAYVTFEPGARSAWHMHPAGQRLVVISGVGLTQEWGKPVREIRPGDVVVCPAGVKHWHGATSTTAMTHLAVSGVLDGRTVEWMEEVTHDQYMDR
jgi:quercetin dioxygenase-like cupin family protein